MTILISLKVFGINKSADSRTRRSLTHTVVTEAAVGGSGRPEDLAGETILQLDRLAVDDHLLGPGRRPVAGAAVSHVLVRMKRKTRKKHNKSS